MRKWLMSGTWGAVLALMVLSPLAVMAATPAPAASSGGGGSPGQGLEISPPVIELSANPGQTVTTTIRVRNVTAGELIAKGQADDFGAGSDESGQPKLLLNETGANRYSLKYWVTGIPDLDLAPQELKTTNVVIKIPANAEPGGHYGVVRFTAVPPNLKGTGVALSASVGTLILMRVNGQITDSLNMAQFSVMQKNKESQFFEYGPLDFLVRIHNGGSVHEEPIGTIKVNNMFGKTIATLAVNDKHGNVLPDSVRRFTATLASKKLFGHYTAKLALTYATNKSLSATVSFWVIPWRLILLGLVAIVVLYFLLKLALRKYNEHIIAQARRR